MNNIANGFKEISSMGCLHYMEPNQYREHVGIPLVGIKSGLKIDEDDIVLAIRNKKNGISFSSTSKALKGKYKKECGANFEVSHICYCLRTQAKNYVKKISKRL